MNTIKIAYFWLKTEEKLSFGDVPRLRGYLLYHFPEVEEFHERGYRYPLIQYKVLQGKGLIVGLGEGADVIESVAPRVNEVIIKDRYIDVIEKRLISTVDEVGPTDGTWMQYSFTTPWLALNPANYNAYRQCETWKEKKLLLNRILIGNILSLSKGLNLHVESELQCHTYLIHTGVIFRGIQMSGFFGNFQVPFKLPEHIGIGKAASKGFGTVVPVKGPQDFQKILRSTPEPFRSFYSQHAHTLKAAYR